MNSSINTQRRERLRIMTTIEHRLGISNLRGCQPRDCVGQSKLVQQCLTNSHI
jgi:hypothetical protein